MWEQNNRIVFKSLWRKLNVRTHGLTVQRTSLIKPVVLMLSVTFAVYVQTATPADSKRADAEPRPTTDAEKIEDALSAGPRFATKNATVLDWPAKAGDEYRVLRQGSNSWTCLPGIPGRPHNEPGCFDQVFLQFMKDSLAGRTPNVKSVGISYMYGGFWVPNKSHAIGSANEFHVGPHIMIIGPDQKMLQTMNRDASTGEPYVNHLPGRSELYLVIPIREWDEKEPKS